MVSLGAWGRPGLLGRTRQISTVSSGERAGSGGIERTWSSKRPAGKSRCCHALPLRRRSPTGRHDNPARWLQLRGCGGDAKSFCFPTSAHWSKQTSRCREREPNPCATCFQKQESDRQKNSLARSFSESCALRVELDFRGNRSPSTLQCSFISAQVLLQTARAAECS